MVSDFTSVEVVFVASVFFTMQGRLVVLRGD